MNSTVNMRMDFCMEMNSGSLHSKSCQQEYLMNDGPKLLMEDLITFIKVFNNSEIEEVDKSIGGLSSHMANYTRFSTG